jgi:hypothetical protein
MATEGNLYILVTDTDNWCFDCDSLYVGTEYTYIQFLINSFIVYESYEHAEYPK